MMKIRFGWVCALGILSACGVANTQSNSRGHFENSSELELVKYKGMQTVVPEYAPSESVLISADLLVSYEANQQIRAMAETDVASILVVGSEDELADFNNEVERSALLSPFQAKFKNLVDEREHTVWARDWAPLFAKNAASELQLLDLNYYPRRQADDAIPSLMERLNSTTRISLPVYNEGGNFMINDSRDCLATERVSDANRSVQVEGDMVLNKEQIAEYFKNYAGCKTARILPRLPSEGTGHIDMWAKFLTDDTILVGEISNDVLQQLGSRIDVTTNKAVQQFLNKQAAELAALGFKIVRVPMPVVDDGVYRSYTNSLLLNGTAIIPQYKKTRNGSKYPDDAFLTRYETAVTQAYESAGFKVQFAVSDRTISMGGAVHCTTMQIPR